MKGLSSLLAKSGVHGVFSGQAHLSLLASPLRGLRAQDPPESAHVRVYWGLFQPEAVSIRTNKGQTRAIPFGRIIREIGNAIGTSLTTVGEIARRHSPFEILVSTVISLRTKDEVTAAASERLFAIAPDADALARTRIPTIEKAIYPAGFYRTKARDLKRIAREIVAKHDGNVPDTIETLLEFKGVGRKTANLVITLGYGKQGICVDTHVHRISNRLGWVDTKTPDHTEFALMEVLPAKYWIGINELMVSFGQQVCKPISPHCSTCPLAKLCPRIGVTKSR